MQHSAPSNIRITAQILKVFTMMPIPDELLFMVFSVLCGTSLNAAAMVCKRWRRIAQSIIWKHITAEVWRALPGTNISNPDYVDNTHTIRIGRPTQNEWTRFIALAGYMRSLAMKTKIGHSANLYGTSVDEIVYNAPKISKLQHLSTGVLSLIPIIYPPTLHTLVASFDFYPTKCLEEDRSIHNVHNMAIRCTELNTLILRGSLLHQRKDPSIERILRMTLGISNVFAKLTRIDLPLYYLTDTDLTLLSTLPTLARLRVDTVGSWRGMLLPEKQLENLTGVVSGPNPFPSLTEFGCAASKPSIFHSLLSSCHGLQDHIETIWLRFPNPSQYTATDINVLLDALASNCRRLSELTLVLAASVCQPVLPNSPLSWDDLQPILRMTLKHLCITSTMPLAISDDNVEALAASQPRIVVLSLNPQPIFYCAPGLTVSCLSAISRHCPILEHIELFLDARRPIAHEAMRKAQEAPHLSNLFFGLSPAPPPLDIDSKDQNNDWTTLGHFLQKILTPYATITSYTYRSQRLYEAPALEHGVDTHPHLHDGLNTLIGNGETWKVMDQAVCRIRHVPGSN